MAGASPLTGREILAVTRQAGGVFKIEHRAPGDGDRLQLSRARISDGSPLRARLMREWALDPLALAQGARASRDPVTGHVDLPRVFGEKRGRPAKGKRAMTDAERARAYRARKLTGG